MANVNRRGFLRWASAGTAAVAVLGKLSNDVLADEAGADSSDNPGRGLNLIGVQADDGSTVVAQHVLDSRTVDIIIDSMALGQTGAARVLLPAHFRSRPNRTWPVFYLLHGAFDSYVSWTRSTDVEKLTRNTDVLVVMPEAGRFGFYSDWWDHGAGKIPGWETFHLTELRQILERGLRAGSHRVVAGLSMGGFGTMSYAGRNPTMFRAAASFSGVLDSRYSSASSDFILAQLRNLGFDPLALWGSPIEQVAIWAAHNPVDLLPNLRGQGIRLFVGAGNGQPGPLDPPGTTSSDPAAQTEAALFPMSEKFVGIGRALGLDVTVDLYGPGTHTWPYWQRELHRAFPLLMGAIGLEVSSAAA
jgi:S-formylglutathione hydrolase FrmB